MCDTHVIRLSRRLGLSENSDPVKLEFDLMAIVPWTKFGGWTMFSHYLIWHGRTICIARKPDCPHCPIAPTAPPPTTPNYGKHGLSHPVSFIGFIAISS